MRWDTTGLARHLLYIITTRRSGEERLLLVHREQEQTRGYRIMYSDCTVYAKTKYSLYITQKKEGRENPGGVYVPSLNRHELPLLHALVIKWSAVFLPSLIMKRQTTTKRQTTNTTKARNPRSTSTVSVEKPPRGSKARVLLWWCSHVLLRTGENTPFGHL